MKLSTQSEVTHHTTLTCADRISLSEMLDLIRAKRSTGKLTINFNSGGITSVTFEEHRKVTRQELDTLDSIRLGSNGNGHLSHDAMSATSVS